MVDINALKDLEYLLTFSPDNPGLKSIIARESSIQIENICLSFNLCPICGKGVISKQIAIPEYRINTTHLLDAMVCEDANCDYTKLVIERHTISDEEYRLYGGKHKYLTLNGIPKIRR